MQSVSLVKRQTESVTHNENEAELCKGRPPSEYFRLTADDDCRDVVRCSVQGLLALRCPSGLAFDIEKQTCDWKSNVKNCAQLESKFFLLLSPFSFCLLLRVVCMYSMLHFCICMFECQHFEMQMRVLLSFCEIFMFSCNLSSLFLSHV